MTELELHAMQEFPSELVFQGWLKYSYKLDEMILRWTARQGLTLSKRNTQDFECDHKYHAQVQYFKSLNHQLGFWFPRMDSAFTFFQHEKYSSKNLQFKIPRWGYVSSELGWLGIQAKKRLNGNMKPWVILLHLVSVQILFQNRDTQETMSFREIWCCDPTHLFQPDTRFSTNECAIHLIYKYMHMAALLFADDTDRESKNPKVNP